MKINNIFILRCARDGHEGLVGEEGPRIPWVKVCAYTACTETRVCFLKTLSALLTSFRFLICLFLYHFCKTF